MKRGRPETVREVDGVELVWRPAAARWIAVLGPGDVISMRRTAGRWHVRWNSGAGEPIGSADSFEEAFRLANGQYQARRKRTRQRAQRAFAAIALLAQEPRDD